MPVIVQQNRKKGIRMQLKRTDGNSCLMFLIYLALMAAPVVSALLALRTYLTLDENSDFTYYIITGKLFIWRFLMHSNSKRYELNDSILD